VKDRILVTMTTGDLHTWSHGAEQTSSMTNMHFVNNQLNTELSQKRELIIVVPRVSSLRSVLGGELILIQ
jgi:hypothetical protein